jgi:hypothetical protein
MDREACVEAGCEFPATEPLTRLCIGHFVKQRRAGQPKEEPGDMERLRALLRIPSGAYLHHYPIDGAALHPKWAGYSAELVTIEGAAAPFAGYPKSWSVLLPGAPATAPRTLIRWRAWRVGGAGYLPLTWRPRHGEWIDLRGPRHELKERGLDAFLDLVRTHIGPGRRRLEDNPASDWRAIADQAEEIKRNNSKLTWAIIADTHFNLGASTLGKYRRKRRRELTV